MHPLHVIRACCGCLALLVLLSVGWLVFLAISHQLALHPVHLPTSLPSLPPVKIPGLITPSSSPSAG